MKVMSTNKAVNIVRICAGVLLLLPGVPFVFLVQRDCLPGHWDADHFHSWYPVFCLAILAISIVFVLANVWIAWHSSNEDRKYHVLRAIVSLLVLYVVTENSKWIFEGLKEPRPLWLEAFLGTWLGLVPGFTLSALFFWRPAVSSKK